MKGIKLSSQLIGFQESIGLNRFMVKTDMKRLQQVLLNLVANAAKFTDRNQSISIVAELLNDPLSLKVMVTDTGCGIKAENQPKLFQMFGTFKDKTNKINTNGIGLGLVICKLIVEKFGGKIWFKSTEGRGTSFTYTFELH